MIRKGEINGQRERERDTELKEKCLMKPLPSEITTNFLGRGRSSKVEGECGMKFAIKTKYFT